MSPNIIYSAIKKQKIIPLFFHSHIDICIQTIDTLYGCGIRIVEFTNRGDNALDSFRELAVIASTRWKDLLLGIGTIRTAQQAKDFIEAGAAFIISPFVVEEIAPVISEKNIPWMPGCITPYEINIAVNLGCQLVKLFPGNLISPDYVKGIKEIFPGIDFMPTGGVGTDPDELKKWFQAGVCAVGMGSKLVSKDLLAAGDYGSIAERTVNVLDIAHRL